MLLDPGPRLAAQQQWDTVARGIEQRLFGEPEGGAARGVIAAVVRVARPGDGEAPALDHIDRLLDMAAAQIRRGLPTAVQFIYGAMWNARRKNVSSFVCLPTAIGADGVRRVGDAVLGGATDAEAVAVLDQMAIEAVGEELTRLIDNGRRVFLTFPIHYSTVANADRFAACTALLQAMPEGQRRLLVAEVVDLPEFVDFVALTAAGDALWPLTRAVLVRLPLATTAFEPCREAGVTAVGIDLSEPDAPEARIIPQLESFAAGASRYGLRSYVHRLPSLSLTTASVCAGFHHIDGDAVASVVEAPRGSYPLDPGALYAKLASDAGARADI